MPARPRPHVVLYGEFWTLSPTAAGDESSACVVTAERLESDVQDGALIGWRRCGPSPEFAASPALLSIDLLQPLAGAIQERRDWWRV